LAALGSCDTTKETKMKKALLASAALLSGVGVAYAEDGVSISGLGRFGLTNTAPDIGDSETRVDARLRFNINATKETDAGVTFGGRIRLQWDDGAQEAGLSAAYVYAEASGFRVEVGNSNAAYDSAGLMYNSEVGTGYFGSSWGNPLGSYYGFSTGSLGDDDYMGVYTQYSVGDLTARLSFISPDQGLDDNPPATNDREDEISVSFDYATGPFAVSLAFAQDGGGVLDNDLFFIGAQYTLNDRINLGILFNDNGNTVGFDNPATAAFDPRNIGDNTTITLYGNMAFGATTVQAYVSSLDSDLAAPEDIAVGIGANYDLGGASLGGSIESGFDGSTFAKIGVGFSF
jgi:outer membrane protein OmpU